MVKTFEEWRKGKMIDAVGEAYDGWYARDAEIAEKVAPGPCGKHPKIFWQNDMPQNTRQFRGDGKEEFCGHCSICKEVAERENAARLETVERARLAYNSHTHSSIGMPTGSDKCAICGSDIRDGVHLRCGETTENRISALRAAAAKETEK